MCDTPNDNWGTIAPLGPKNCVFFRDPKIAFFFRDGKPPQDQGWKGAKTHLNKKNKKIEDMGI